MNTVKDEVTSACDVAIKSALNEFGEALMQYWPTALTVSLTSQTSERVRAAVEESMNRILATNLLGLNVSEAEKIVAQLSSGAGVQFRGKIGDLAVKGAGPGRICEVSDDKVISVPLPSLRDRLSGALEISVHVASALLSQDRKWDTKAAINVTITGTWSWQKDFGPSVIPV